MTIDELLDIMDETLEEATTLPFTGGKRMVDVEKVRDIMDDIRLSMPQEIKQARAIVEDRGRIAQSREMRATVTGYCENMLRRTEEQLAQSLTDVKTVRTTLRQTSKKGLGEKRQPRGEG